MAGPREIVCEALQGAQRCRALQHRRGGRKRRLRSRGQWRGGIAEGAVAGAPCREATTGGEGRPLRHGTDLREQRSALQQLPRSGPQLDRTHSQGQVGPCDVGAVAAGLRLHHAGLIGKAAQLLGPRRACWLRAFFAPLPDPRTRPLRGCAGFDAGSVALEEAAHRRAVAEPRAASRPQRGQERFAARVYPVPASVQHRCPPAARRGSV
mmetsp:Transcript_118880/g.341442  ORF Transcript_118880/g.341442 Transcript_118880/m.341442 type:complete len:209 (-) Transcript_118880:796-1422(-)